VLNSAKTIVSCSLPSDQINSTREFIRTIEQELGVKIDLDAKSHKSEREYSADAIYLIAAVITIIAEGDVAYSKTKTAANKIVAWLKGNGVKSSILMPNEQN
jgi:hypothetical protein